MANKITKGRDLMLFDNSGHSYAYATSHTFSMSAETADISSKDHGVWGASEVSKYTWSISSENLYTPDGYDAMFSALVAGNPITIRFGLKTEQVDMTKNVADGDLSLPYWTSGSSYYEGKAIITSLTANANNGENATYSVELTGVGAISKTTPNAQGAGE